MQLFFSPYVLQKKTPLNAQDNFSKTQAGALLKVVQGEHWGVADLCPHPELGDASVESEMMTKGLLFLRSTELAIEDLLARKNKVSLLQNKKVKNNYLVSNYRQTDLNQSGYVNQSVKIKGDQNISELADKLNHISISMRLRLDFNSCLSDDEFNQFLDLLTRDTLAKVEYIEDPTLLNENWRQWNLKVALAFDFQKENYAEAFARYRIIKPSRQRVPSDLKNFTLTSAMDHPVGVAHGLRIAQQLAQNDSGFMTLDLYERTGFNRYFQQEENRLGFSDSALQDYGIGMSEELEKLEWKSL
jgi:o-succinylbenzoate synthase